jgi:S-adenosylmethionine:tRNA ribosyltransferase-isomerase
MLLSDFDYALPDELIARHPAAERRASRLLLVGDELQDRSFSGLPALLAPDDLLVFNDTRVIRARLRGVKDTGGRVEAMVERITGDREVTAQVRASKSPRAGARILFAGGATATVEGRSGGMFRLRFSLPVGEYLQEHGEVPLPPYLGREEESADDERYQTVYARHDGAVAAPTAGLHFDDAMLEETRSAGIRHAFVTLHVGAGTFQPLRETSIDANQLHAERLSVSEAVCEAVRATRQRGGRVIAVGTTSVRALESASASGEIAPSSGETSLFIRPGYDFRSVDAMLTNFHLPRSSLLVLVSAFAGHERIMAAYRHAVRERYRFFSYGDAMLIFPGSK